MVLLTKLCLVGLLSLVSAGIAIGERDYREFVSAGGLLISACGEYREAKALYQEAAIALDRAQTRLEKCEEASCAAPGSDELKSLEEAVKREWRRREFRGAWVSFIGSSHRSFPIEYIDEYSSAEVAFYLGSRKDLSGRKVENEFEYLRTGLPAIVRRPEVFKNKEFGAYQEGMGYRLFASPEYYWASKRVFAYSVAGRVKDICVTIEAADGEVFSFGQVVGGSQMLPLGIDISLTVSVRTDVEDETNLNFFPILESFLEEAFGISPLRRNALNRYKPACYGWGFDVEGDIVGGVWRVRNELANALGDWIEGGWPTTIEVWAKSETAFSFEKSVRDGVYLAVPVMTLRMAYGENELGTIEFERFYGPGVRGGVSSWKLVVRAIRVDDIVVYACKRA